MFLEGQLQTCSVVRFRVGQGQVQRREVKSFPQSEMQHYCQKEIAVTGVLDRLANCIPSGIQLVGQPPWDNSRPSIAAIVLDRVRAKRFDDPMTIEPFYVRPSSAEEKWASRNN